MTDLLQIRDLTVEYTTRRGTARAVDKVSLTVEENKTLGLAGESGCGKSTLGRAVIGLVPAPGRIVEGEVILDLDEDVPYGEKGVVKSGHVNLTQLDTAQYRALRGRKLAYIFQDPMTSLNPMLTIGKHFTQLIRTHDPRVKKEEALDRAGDILEALGILPERLGDYPHQFSGGMRQRVMIGLALALQPRLLIADEPTTSLDVIVEAQILEQVAQLKKKFNLTTILMTHNLGVLAQVADSIAIMYCGRLMEVASTEALFADPQHPYTQALLRSVPDVTKPEKKLTGIPGAPPDLVNPISGCMFRPRCPQAMKVCVSQVPPLIKSQTKGLVACHLYKEGKTK
jgi:oligopeptide/dipeptide ABC transporter ATP-binding protein